MVRTRETAPRGSCLTTAPYLKLALLLLLGEEREKLSINIVFIRKYTLGKKFKKSPSTNENLHLCTNQWKGAKLAGQQGQAVKEQPSSPRTLRLCIDQLQVDVLAEQGTGGAGQGRGRPCCHVQSLPTEPQQVCLLQQLCNTKWHQSGHPRSWQGGCPTPDPTAAGAPPSQPHPGGKMEFVQKYLVFIITQRGCLVCCGN